MVEQVQLETIRRALENAKHQRVANGVAIGVASQVANERVSEAASGRSSEVASAVERYDSSAKTSSLPGSILDFDQFTTAKIVQTSELKLLGSPIPSTPQSPERKSASPLQVLKDGQSVYLLHKSYSEPLAKPRNNQYDYMVYEDKANEDVRSLDLPRTENRIRQLLEQRIGTTSKQPITPNRTESPAPKQTRSPFSELKRGRLALDSTPLSNTGSLYNVIKVNPLAIPLTAEPIQLDSSITTPAHAELSSVSLCSQIIASADFCSPIPQLKYSNLSEPLHNAEMKLRSILEELSESEATYLTSLKMLLSYYIEPFLATNREFCGVPIVLISETLQMLIINHNSLMRLFAGCDSLEQAAIAAVKALEGVAINVHLYEEYCNLYEFVLNLVRSHKFIDTLLMDNSWVRTWQIYLEATQPNTKHMDLSFISLMQRPISRVSKYRLIAEAILKQMEALETVKVSEEVADNDTDQVNTLKEHIAKMKVKLDYINGQTDDHRKRSRDLEINNMLKFDDVIECKKGFKLSSQFFGKDILIGVSFLVWLQNAPFSEKGFKVRGSTVGLFLYKSHLVVANITSRRDYKGYDVRHVIPLSRCQMVKDGKDTLGGLYSNYPYAIKIVYEHGFRQYEILLAFLTKREFIVWLSHFETLIDFVNGPYGLDYHQAVFPVVVHTPVGIAPYDVSPQDHQTMKVFKESCYFKQSTSIDFMIDFQSIDYEDIFLLAAYFNHANMLEFLPDHAGESQVMYIKRAERLLGEQRLAKFISSELPLIFHRGQEPTPTRQRLKKSLSWSSLRMTPMAIPDTLTEDPPNHLRVKGVSTTKVDELLHMGNNTASSRGDVSSQFSFRSTGTSSAKRSNTAPSIYGSSATPRRQLEMEEKSLDTGSTVEGHENNSDIGLTSSRRRYSWFVDLFHPTGIGRPQR